MSGITSLFHIDRLALIMGGLILFVSLCVGCFSWRYLSGDTAQRRFYLMLSMLVVSVMILVSVDNVLLFLGAWAISNLLLVRLMIHKASWKAARESGRLAFKNYAVGFVALAAAATLLYAQTGETSIQAITAYEYPKTFLIGTLSLIFIAAMSQSALWPFHRWLTSSLNSPTPVSAIMHAGLINGGGFLLVRFASLYLELPQFLPVVFVAGLFTALLGTLWKLMQNDVKRMLACSTMGQMGFMVVQCGLGLFPAAIAHLFWHGLFKAYLFLASGSAAQEKRFDLGYPPRATVFLLSILCGTIGAYAFIFSSHTNPLLGDTTLFLIGMSFIAATQLSMPILRDGSVKKLPLAMISAVLAGLLYGFSVYSFDQFLPNLMQPQPISFIHVAGFIVLVSAWLGILFGRTPEKSSLPSRWILKIYVWMLNLSQPHPKTITTHRNDYQYQ